MKKNIIHLLNACFVFVLNENEYEWNNNKIMIYLWLECILGNITVQWASLCLTKLKNWDFP